MSSIETVKCDGCDKTVKEGENKWWIRINANEDYSVDIMEGGDLFAPIATDQKDFCSPKCLCRWIKEQYGAKS